MSAEDRLQWGVTGLGRDPMALIGCSADLDLGLTALGICRVDVHRVAAGWEKVWVTQLVAEAREERCELSEVARYLSQPESLKDI